MAPGGPEGRGANQGEPWTFWKDRQPARDENTGPPEERVLSSMSPTSRDMEARERFRRSVNQAQIADLLALVTGADTDLVSYEEVAGRLRARQQIEMGTQMVPLEKIVGSVGRYKDFTRTFLPRAGVNEDRWLRVDNVVNSMEGMPPIDLFQIGDVYFVQDGNHRVSAARANGIDAVEAYVTEVISDVDLKAEDFTDGRWILKAERSDFLRATGLDALRPDHNIYLTVAGRYPFMLQHIQAHHYLRNQDLARAGLPELSWPEAVASWYDHVYMPVVNAIHDYDLLHDFPGRTEADLYLWIAHHRERLATEYSLAPLSPTEAVATFAETHADSLLGKALMGLRLGWRRAVGDGNLPPGMSETEFLDLRERHEAGELSLAEAEALASEMRASETPAREAGAQQGHDS